MYLDISAFVGIGIALVLSTLTVIYSMTENAILRKEITRLRFRIRDLNKQVERNGY